MSVTFNVTTLRFRSVLVMVASIDSLSALASRLTARLAPVGSLARTLGAGSGPPGPIPMLKLISATND